jgi:predicted CoA-substrate-specific enzyme activase
VAVAVTQEATGMLYVGVDVGASAVKVVALDARRGIVGEGVARTRVDLDAAAQGCLDEVLSAHGLTMDQVAAATATGFGRHNVSFATATKTEIGCHAKGCFHYFPMPITIIDIGGQDNKIIRLDEKGNTVDFKMNRKCAAGTGAFIEEIAERLGVELSQLDALATSSTETVELGSFCTVFSKTEVLARMREGRPLAGILRGALQSVVQRVVEIDPLDGDVVMSGGVVAHNPLVAELMEQRLGRKILLPPSPQTIGALGAALFALAANARPASGETK